MPRTTILLLETDEEAVRPIESFLSAKGFQITTVSCLRDAFETLKKHSRDLAIVILNFELATDDVDVLDRIRKLDFEVPPPVFLLGEVALEEAEITQLASDSGYSGYLWKAMPEEKLWGNLERFCDNALDLRKFPRVYFQARAHVMVEGIHFMGETYTLSQKGAFVALRGSLPEEGKKGFLTLSLADENQKAMRLQFEVVRRREVDEKTVSIHPSGIGVRFIDCTERDENILIGLVQLQLEKGFLSKVAS